MFSCILIQFVCFGKCAIVTKLHIFIDTEIHFCLLRKQLFTNDPEFRKTNLFSHIPIWELIPAATLSQLFS